MADPTIDEKHKKNREIYEALLRGKGNRVIELFKQVPKGPLHVLTMHQDTVLHMATFSEQQDIVSNLLRELPEENTDISSRSNMMLLVTVKNDWGNTLQEKWCIATFFLWRLGKRHYKFTKHNVFKKRCV
ncbi:hypothetical protein CsSME_00037408 [Camellia sinensis var. sinensis]